MQLDEIKALKEPFESLGMKVPHHNTRCPAHGGSDSVSTSIKDGLILWRCHNCGEGGTIVDAYMHAHGMEMPEAMQALSREYGDGVDFVFDKKPPTFEEFKPKEKPKPTRTRLPAVDEIIAGRLARRKVRVTFKGDSHYTDVLIKDATSIDVQAFESNGKPQGIAVLRFDKGDTKTITQAHFNGMAWQLGAPRVDMLPIYNFDKITEDTTVVMVEGEKCMHAMQKALDKAHFDYPDTVPKTLVTTIIGGSNALSRCDLSPLTVASDVIIIPDNDKPGIKLATQIKQKLSHARIISPYPEKAWDGYDGADWVDQGHDVRAIFQVEREVEVSEDPIQAAMLTAARLDSSQLESFFEKLNKLDIPPHTLDAIFNQVQMSTGLTKTVIKETWKYIGKKFQVDWPTAIADIVIDKYFKKNIIYATKAFWAYTGTHWAYFDDFVVQHMIVKAIESGALPVGAMDHATCLDKSFKLIKAKVGKDEEVMGFAKPPKPIINCRNGELHIDSATGSVELKKHDPKSMLTYCLDVDYDPLAVCPQYDNAIDGIFEGNKDMIRHFNEIGGYLIQPIRDFKSFFIMYGAKGHNGKTSLLKCVTALMGQNSVAPVRLSKFGESRFDNAYLVGKLLMIDDDLDKGVRLNDGVMKQISEEKLMTAEFKGKTQFSFISYVAPVMLTNHYPFTSDLTKAMLERAEVVPFTAYFDPNDPKTDKQLFRRIIREELSGILNRFLEGLGRVRQRQRWLHPKRALEARDEWLNETSNTHRFNSECLVPCVGESITLNDLYDAYKNWVRSEGMDHSIKKISLKRSMEEMGIFWETTSNKYGGWRLHDFTLRSPE